MATRIDAPRRVSVLDGLRSHRSLRIAQISAVGGARRRYAVKALLATEGRAAAEAEHRWQRAQLPAEVAALVLSTFREAPGYPELMRG